MILGIFTCCCLVVVWKILKKKQAEAEAKEEWQEVVKKGNDTPLTLHPEIDIEKCSGCGACTLVCPEGDILQLIGLQAKLINPTKCVGHGECEKACPMDAIKLVFGTKTKGMEIPRLTKNYETNISDLYIAGELGGMGLIRNAIKQGSISARHAIQSLNHLKTKTKTDTDLLIIGAGPAGFSAALEAKDQGINFLCLEQNSFGGTIANFPRQKIVMSYPFSLPGHGKVKFSSNKVSKEEILELWDRIAKKNNLKIQEKTTFKKLDRDDQIFKIETSNGILTCKKVILAMGVRGSPRRLGLPNEDLPKVTYNLVDPELYQGKSIIVVGGGNAGVEAAQMLGNPQYRNKVNLFVRGEAFDRCNQDNIDRINSMASRKEVTINFKTKIEEIHHEYIVASHLETKFNLKNDYIFVFAGAEVPFKLLNSFGILIDKKFAQPLSSE